MSANLFAMVAALAMCSAPTDLIDTVDVWEQNSFVSADSGKEVFKQQVFWRVETHDTGKAEVTDFFVAAWRMDGLVRTIPNREGVLYVGRFYDPKNKVFRLLRAKQLAETETTVDYEAVDRSRLDDAKRSGLRKHR